MLQPRQNALESTPWGSLSWVADPGLFPIDSNGNLSTKVEGADTWAYEWNANNDLTRVTKNSVEQARFSYDPIGRRVEKVAGGLTTSYTYDDEDILREIRGGSTLKYEHGWNVDEPLAREDAVGALTYYHVDALGSIVKRTDQAGAAASEHRYDAWGALEMGASESGYAFAGREWDAETQLFYYRARYYDARIGRFISQDPIGYADTPNPYVYVRNDPVGLTDPSGLITWQVHERVYEKRGGVYQSGQTGWGIKQIYGHCREVDGKWNLEFYVEARMSQFVPAGDGAWARYIRRHENWHRQVQRANMVNWAKQLEQAEGWKYCSEAECKKAASDAKDTLPDYDTAVMKNNMDLSTRFKRFFLLGGR